MIVPRYWAEARVVQQVRGRSCTVCRFGWSDRDAADAQAHAQARAEEAMARILAGETLPRRERRVGYGGAEGVPIREEIVEAEGDIVVTRNSYGALCLNTPDVLFADMDCPPFEPDRRWAWRALLLSTAILTALAMLLGSIRIAPAAVVGFLVSCAWLGAYGKWVADPREAREADVRAQAWRHDAMLRIRRFAQAHPDWHLRIYRTPAGLRVLVLHATFDPDAPAVEAFFAALQVDPVYARMCRHQRCFRARISPKPWRVGVERMPAPSRAAWRPEYAALPQRVAWIHRYDQAASGYASCRFVEALGTEIESDAAAQVRRMHDLFCRADSELPLA